MDDVGGFENLLRLQLKKPKSWNCELSLSKSAANIDFPRILLYDDEGSLLVDTQEAGSFFVKATIDKIHNKHFRNVTDKILERSKSVTQLTRENFSSESDPPKKKRYRRAVSSIPSRFSESFLERMSAMKCRNLSADELSDIEKKSVDEKEKKEKSRNVRFELHKSKSTTDVREPKKRKRKCRRAVSSAPSQFSDSFLERMSALRCRNSSPETETHRVQMVSTPEKQKAKYLYRKSNAGILIIPENPFENYAGLRKRSDVCLEDVADVKESPTSLMKSDSLSKELLRKYKRSKTTHLITTNHLASDEDDHKKIN